MERVNINKLNFTERCIWFDKHLWDKPRDESNLYLCILFIVKILTIERKYFISKDTLDDFIAYASSHYYKRFIKYAEKYKTAENFKKENGHNSSIVNYISNTIYFTRCNYLTRGYLKSSVVNGENYCEDYKNSLKLEYSRTVVPEVELLIKRLPNIIKDVINQTPYRNDTLMVKRLYKSILLSFIKSLTYTEETKHTIDYLIEHKSNVDYYITTKLIKEMKHSTTCWHLTKNMKDYVDLLITKVKLIFSQELSSSISYHCLSDNELEEIMQTAYTQELFTNEL